MKIINKYKNFILLTIGILLIILSFCLLFYDKFVLLKENVFDEIELFKYRENNQNEDNVTEVPDDNLIVENIETEDINETSSKNTQTKDTSKKEKEYIGYLQIEKINLRQGLVSKKSYYNNVDRNILTINESDYPDKEKGNVILAAHSGTSSVSYFKNLYKLVVGDEAKIFYKGYIYTYKIVDIYNVLKTGSVEINRDVNKNCLTLITCTHNSNTEQTVYILELTSTIKESDS